MTTKRSHDAMSYAKVLLRDPQAENRACVENRLLHEVFRFWRDGTTALKRTMSH
jgi:hypothetical protein